MHDLQYVVAVLTCTQPFNPVRYEHSFQFQLFYTDVTFKYSQGHCKWFEFVKFSEYY